MSFSWRDLYSKSLISFKYVKNCYYFKIHVGLILSLLILACKSRSVPCCDLFKLFLARIRRLREVRWNKTKTYSFYCCPSVLFLSQNVTLRGRKSSLKHFLYIKTGLNRQNLIFFLSVRLESETWSLRILATGNYLLILPYGF